MDDTCDLLCLDAERGQAIRRTMPTRELMEAAAMRAKALGDPTRLGVAYALSQADELCVCDLAWTTGRAENLVSHHARGLRAAGLATSRRDGKLVLYALTPAGRAALDVLLSEVPA